MRKVAKAIGMAALGLAMSGCSVDKAGRVAMAASGEAAGWGSGWSAQAAAIGQGRARVQAKLSPWARGGDGGGHEATLREARSWCALMGRGEPVELSYAEGWRAGPLGGVREAGGDYGCAPAQPGP